MEKGTNADELFVDQKTRKITIEYKNKEWDFIVRDLSWKEKAACITAGTIINITGKKKMAKKTVTMDMCAYNQEYLMKSIVKAPFSVTPVSFMKLDGEFGDLLVEAIIEPESGDDEEMGNSEIVSEE